MSTAKSQTSFVSNLKLKLKYFHTDFQNLTADDLLQLKWIQKQKILTILFERSIHLQDYQNELIDLIEKKNRQLNQLKENRTNEGKNVKIELEANFRTDLIRIFIQGLEKLQWKRCLEAFADPLGDMMADNSVFLEALDYVLTIELDQRGVSSSSIGGSGGFGAFDDSVSPSTPSQQPPGTTSSNASTTNRRKRSQPPTPSLVKELSNVSMMSVPNSARTEASAFDDYSIASSSKPPPPSSSSHPTVPRGFSAMSDHRSISSSKPNNVNQSSDFTLEYVQRLQQQNSLLTKRMKFLEESIRRKEEIEGMMYNLIVELKMSVRQLAELTQVPSSSQINEDKEKTTPSKESTSTSASTKKSQRVCPHCKNPLEHSSTPTASSEENHHTTSNKTNNNNINNSTGNWKRLYGKVEGMEKEWNEIHTRIRQTVADKIYHDTRQRHQSHHTHSRNQQDMGSSSFFTDNDKSTAVTINDLQKDLIELHFSFNKFFASCFDSSSTNDNEEEDEGDYGDDDENGVGEVNGASEMNRQMQTVLEQLVFYQRLWMKSQQTSLKINTLLTSELMDGQAMSLEEDHENIRNNSDKKGKQHSTTNPYRECFELIQTMMNTKSVSGGNKNEVCLNVLELIQSCYYQHQLLLKSYTALSLQFQQLVKYLEAIFKNYQFFSIERYNLLLENSYDKIHEKLSLLPKLCGYLDVVERDVRVPNTFTGNGAMSTSKGNGSMGAMVNPLDALTRGVFGKEMAAIVEILRSNRLTWAHLKEEIDEIHSIECEKFLKEQEDFKAIMKNVMKFKAVRKAIRSYYRQEGERHQTQSLSEQRGIGSGAGRGGGQSPQSGIRRSPRQVGSGRLSSRSKGSPKSTSNDLADRPAFNLSFN